MKPILAIFAALATYGSIYPFSFEPDAADWSDLLSFLGNWSLETTRGNFIANILLFAPIGFAGFFAHNEAHRQRLALGLTISLATTLAFALQVVQLWIPGRNPVIGDAIINLIGLIVGVFSASLLSRLGVAGSSKKQNNVLIIPVVLALLWVTYRWFPLVPTLDLQNIKNSLKPLLLEPHIKPTQVLLNTATWTAWIFMLLRCGIAGLGMHKIAGLAVIVFAMQPLFIGNTININNMLGFGLALLCIKVLRHPKSAMGVSAVLLLSLLAAGLQPYQLEPWSNRFEWLPFRGFLSGSIETNALSFIYKCFLYGSTLYALRLTGLKWLTGSLYLATSLFLIELAQIHLPGRSAEITDPILALLIAFTLSRLSATNSINRSTAPPPPL